MILPTPKNRRKRKRVIAKAIKNPLRLLINRVERVKKRAIKRIKKKIGITPKVAGAVK
jgi:hypothetical protein